MPAASRYSDKDVREILERALEAGGNSAASLTHSDLLAIGEQVGVAPDAMARAAAELAREKADAALSSAVKSRRRGWLAAHAAIFAVLNGSFFLVNYLTTPGEWWFLFSVFFWGLALLAHAGLALFAGVSPRALERERGKSLGRVRAPQLRVESRDEVPSSVRAGAEAPEESARTDDASMLSRVKK